MIDQPSCDCECGGCIMAAEPPKVPAFVFPYQIHITVENSGLYELFEQQCLSHNVKPLRIVNVAGVETVDVVWLTNQSLVTTYDQAHLAMQQTRSMLEKGEFKVIREKIETAPWEDHVPTDSNGQLADGYFECHLDAVVDSDKLDQHLDWALENKVHVSYRSINDSKTKLYFTIRAAQCTLEFFKGFVKTPVAKIQQSYDTSRLVIEYCLYDTGYEQDDDWINKRT